MEDCGVVWGCYGDGEVGSTLGRPGDVGLEQEPVPFLSVDKYQQLPLEGFVVFNLFLMILQHLFFIISLLEIHSKGSFFFFNKPAGASDLSKNVITIFGVLCSFPKIMTFFSFLSFFAFRFRL